MQSSKEQQGEIRKPSSVISVKKQKKTVEWGPIETNKQTNNFCCSYKCVCVCVCMCAFQCAQPFVTPWTIACQASLSMGSSKQEYWSGLPCPPPGDLPDGEPTRVSCVSRIAGRFFITESSGKPTPINTSMYFYDFSIKRNLFKIWRTGCALEV